MIRREFRLCGGDQRSVKTDEVCDRPLETFGSSSTSYFWGIVSFETVGSPDKHAGTVCSCHQLNRAEGSPEGRRPFGGVKGQRPLGHPQSTRGHCMQLSPTESRERESRGSKTLWWGQGATPLGSPPINTRALYAVVPNSIARKGVQRVEDPLVGSRGNAPCVTSSSISAAL